MFDKEFIRRLPEDNFEALVRIIKKFEEVDSSIETADQRIKHYNDYIEAFALLETLIESVEISIQSPKLSNNKHEDIHKIAKYFSNSSKKIEEKMLFINLSRAREKYRERFGTVFFYQFTNGDLKRIQTLLNELRDKVSQSELFDQNHKERILKKLEKLQNELHKKMSSLDRLWGLMGDAGIVLGKFGDDAKPFFDRVREILEIVWRTQARGEELPSATPLPLLSKEDIERK